MVDRDISLIVTAIKIEAKSGKLSIESLGVGAGMD
jgi:hypothetical protein